MSEICVNQDNNLFQRENEIILDSENFIKWLQNADINNEDFMPKIINEYFKLHTEYEKMVKQVRKITNICDRNQKRLYNRHRELKENNKQIKRISNENYENMMRDSLTGVFNRRFLNEAIDEAISNKVDNLFLMIIDIDYFKRINDNYGHLIGDEVLKKLSCLVNNSIGTLDIFGRYGGEEFLLLLDEENIDEVVDFAERLRLKVEGFDFFNNEERVNLSVSIGITKIAKSDYCKEDLIGRADIALYRAKDKGRNCVEVEVLGGEE